ncbi:hypothetical protein HDU80_003347 [Chytriomyces hyalinus]|nr:hypothetical protein HDU80_003347 [Chytriomyces hyalinus]
MPMEDPYYAVKEDVESALAKAQQLHTNLKRLVSSRSKSPSFTSSGPANTNNSSNNNNNNTAKELAWTQSELQSAIEAIQADLGDVSAAVRIVAADPRRFGVDAAEVAQRTEFVARVRRHIDEYAATVAASHAPVLMAPPVMTHPAANSNLKKATPKPSRSESNSNNNNNNGNNADMFIGREQGMQQQIMRQQDEQLVGVMSTVGTLKEVAIVMNQELDDQTALLQDLDIQVENTQDKMDMGMKRLKDFIQANADTKQQWTICCLIVALVALLLTDKSEKHSPKMEASQCHWENCAQSFGDAQALYDHLTTDHVTKRIGKGNSDGLRCKWIHSPSNVCSSGFTKRDHLTSHLRIHVPLKPHPCPVEFGAVCKRAFKRPQDLKKHEKLHSEGTAAESQKSARRIAVVGSRHVNTAETTVPVTSEGASGTAAASAYTPTRSIDSVPSVPINGSMKRRASETDSAEMNMDANDVNPGLESIKQFLAEVKRSKFSPPAVLSPQSDVDSNLSAHLDEISKYVATFPPIQGYESPLLQPPHIPSSFPHSMSHLPFDLLSNQDLANVDDYLNSLTTDLLTQLPQDKPSMSLLTYGLQNVPIMTPAYFQSFEHSHLNFQNPSKCAHPNTHETHFSHQSFFTSNHFNPLTAQPPTTQMHLQTFEKSNQAGNLLNPTGQQYYQQLPPPHHLPTYNMQPGQQPIFLRILQEGSKQGKAAPSNMFKRRDSDVSMHEVCASPSTKSPELEDTPAVTKLDEEAENMHRETRDGFCSESLSSLRVFELRCKAVSALKKLIHCEMESRLHQALGFAVPV